MVEYRDIRKRVFCDGTELASFVGSYPHFDEYDKINAFYESLIQNCFEWFSGEFCESLRTEYEVESDRKNKIGRAVYRYALDFVSAEEKGKLSVDCHVLLKKGKKDTVDEFCDKHVWDICNQIMMRRKKEKRHKNKSSG